MANMQKTPLVSLDGTAAADARVLIMGGGRFNRGE